MHAPPQATATAMRSSSGRRAYLYIVGVLWVLPLAAIALGYAVLPKRVPQGGCDGLGWGCSLAPAESVALLGVLVAGPLILAGLTALSILVFLRRSAGRVSRWAPAAQAFTAILAACLVVAFVAVLLRIQSVVTG